MREGPINVSIYINIFKESTYTASDSLERWASKGPNVTSGALEDLADDKILNPLAHQAQVPHHYLYIAELKV